MKYLFTLFADESRYAEATPEEMAEGMKRWDAFTQEAIDSGAHLGGEGLQPTSTATTLRTKGDEQVITDGPFAETKEQLGGYYLLDCKDLDDAIAWAKKIPLGDGSIEVRPVMDYESAGSEVHTSGEGARAS